MTNKPIISMEKVFKKYENMTPTDYRNSYK